MATNSRTWKWYINGDPTGLNKALKSVRRSMDSVSKSLGAFGRQMSVGVSLPIAAAGGGMIKLASDAQEMRGKFNAVFKETAGDVEAWAGTFAEASGRSKFALMEMSSGVQDLLVPMGFARDEASGLATRMSELAVDVGSFNNMSADDVMNNFRSAMIGGHEAVAKFGVIINDATLKQELARMGAEKLTGAALEQAKMQARLNLIIAGTSDAHGDAARTSDSTANKLVKLTSRLKDQATELGERFLPIWSQILDVGLQVVDWMGNLDASTQIVGVAVAGLVAAVGPLSMIFGGLVGAMGALLSPIALIGTALVGLGTTVYLFRDEIGKALEPVAQFFKTYLWEAPKNIIAEVQKLLGSFWSWLFDKAAKIADFVGADEMATSLKSLSEGLDDWGKGQVDVLGMVIEKVETVGSAAMEGVSTFASEAMERVKKEFAAIEQEVGETVNNIENEIVEGTEGAGAPEPSKDPDAEASNERNDARDKETENAKKNFKIQLQEAARYSKAAAAVDGALRLKQTIMNTATSVSRAFAENPFPVNLGIAALMAAKGAAEISTIKGQFHSGIDNVPSSGTYLLEKGERVVDSRLNADLKGFLQAPQRGGDTIHITVNGDPTQEGLDMLETRIREIWNNRGLVAPI